MRYVAFTFAFLLPCAFAQSEDDPYTIAHKCSGADVVLQITVLKPGTLVLMVPHDLCGKDI